MESDSTFPEAAWFCQKSVVNPACVHVVRTLAAC
jgi:hypothetical protein